MKRHAITPKRIQKQLRNFIERKDLLAGVFLVIATGLTLEVLAASVDHAVEKIIDGEHIPAGNWWFIGACSVLILILSLFIWAMREVFQNLHVRYQIQSSAMPKQFLVIFVSRQDLITDLSNNHFKTTPNGGSGRDLAKFRLSFFKFIENCPRPSGTEGLCLSV